MIQFKNISIIIFFLSTTTLSSQITTDTVAFQEKKKREIESTSIFELSLSVLPIGWGECYNSQIGCAYDIIQDFSGGFGISLFGKMINERHILNVNFNYLFTKLEYKKWAVIPDPDKIVHEDFVNSALFKGRYEFFQVKTYI